MAMIENLENEIWKPITGYEGKYEISNLGRIKTLERINCRGVAPSPIKEAIRRTSVKNTGYLRIFLSKDGKATQFPVHRLVLITFLGFHPTLKEVNHINGVKSDNRLENLEWSNRTLNIRHSFKFLGRKSDHSPFKKGKDHILYGSVPSNAKKVRCETLGLNFPSFNAAERALGLYKGSIHEFFLFKRLQIEGLTFRCI